MAVRVMRMHNIDTAPWRVRNFPPQRRSLPRQQPRIMTPRKKSAMEPKHLPLAAAHLPSAVEVQDFHLALEYLRKA
jgi:hypothetical protein